MSTAIKFREVQLDKSISREVSESYPRYFIYLGECEDNKIPTPPNEGNIGLRFINRCEITEITNHSYYDRSQDDRTSSHKRHPDKYRQDEVRITVRAAKFGEFLERRWGSLGGIIIDCFTEVSKPVIVEVVTAILPDSYEDLNEMPLDRLREYLDKNYKTALELHKGPQATLIKSFYNTLLKGIERAEVYALTVLANLKGEMEQRRTDGHGIAKLDERARRLLKLVNRSASDYEVDGQALQHALIKQLGSAAAPQMNIETVAATIAAVLKQLGIGNHQPEPTSPLPAPPEALSEPSYEAPDADDTRRVTRIKQNKEK